MNILRAAAVAVALTATAGAADAALVQSQTFTSDAAFLAYLSNNGVTLPANEVFVAQTRIGNNAANGDYEAGLHTPPNFTNAGPVGTPGQFVWSGWQAFSLTRTGNTIAFSIGNYAGSWTDASVGALDALGFRARSMSTPNTPTSGTQIRNLAFNNVALADPTLDALNGGLELFVLSGIGAGDFTLTGETRLSWTGTRPNGSSLGFQIKGIDGFITEVPEPATLGLLGAGLVGLGLAARRRRRG